MSRRKLTANQISILVRQKKAQEYAESIRYLLEELIENRGMTYNEVAKYMNKHKYSPSALNKSNKVECKQVIRLAERLGIRAA